jgi:hypothetical protein
MMQGFLHEEGSIGVFLLVTIFIHYALFGGTLLSLHYYVVDAVVCLGLGFIGFRTARVGQMLTQYRWINQPNGPLRWRRKAP